MKPRKVPAALLATLLATGCTPAGGLPVAPHAPDPGYVLHDLPEGFPAAGVTLGHQVFLKPSQRTPFAVGHELVHARAGCPVDGEHGLAAYLSGPACLWTGSREEARTAILGFR